LPLLLLLGPAAACRATVPKEPPTQPVELGPLEDVLGGDVTWETVATPSTQVALGTADDLERLLAWRSSRSAEARSNVLLVDVSTLTAAALQSVEDSLVLAAVDPGGAILIDRGGRWVRRLAGPASLPVVIDFLPDGRVGLRLPLSP
jgi:hypothetical protein